MTIATDTIQQFKRFHGMSIEGAISRINMMAAALAPDNATPDILKALADEFVLKYKEVRKAHEEAEVQRVKKERQAVLAKAIHDVAVADLTPEMNVLLVEAIEQGQPVSVVLQANADGQLIPTFSVVVPATGGKKGALVVRGSPKQYDYFHEGVLVNPLSQDILARYPASAAAALLMCYKDKKNKSKLGSWTALEGDEETMAHYTRTEKAPTTGA